MSDRPRRVKLQEAAQVQGPPLDRRPVEVPLWFKQPPTIKEELQRYVRYEVSKIGQQSGYSSFEEEDDFDGEDDEPDWESEYQMSVMQEEAGYEESLDGNETEGESGSVGGPGDSGTGVGRGQEQPTEDAAQGAVRPAGDG